MKHGATKDFHEYVGPGGRGVARSPIQAWREYNGDPVYMPQPKAPATKAAPALPAPANVPMLPSLYAKVPPALALDNAVAASPESSAPASSEMDEVISTLQRLQRDGAAQTCTVHGWRLEYVPRATSSGAKPVGDFYATDPQGNRHRAFKSIRAYFGQSAAPKPRICSPQELRTGQRIRVKWTYEKREFDGTIMEQATQNGALIHKIRYDDGVIAWHNLAKESWTLLGMETQSVVPMSIQAVQQHLLQRRRAYNAKLRMVHERHHAHRTASLISFLQCDDVYGISLQA